MATYGRACQSDRLAPGDHRDLLQIFAAIEIRRHPKMPSIKNAVHPKTLASQSSAANPFLAVCQRLLLFRDRGARRRHFSIQLRVRLPLVRQIIFMKDRLDRTLWHTSFTIDALFRMDVEHLFAFIEALHRANDNAIGIPAAVTRFGDNVGHE